MKKLLALLIALMMLTSAALCEEQTHTVPEDWKAFPITLLGMNISLPADFVADELPEDDPQFLGSWSNEGLTVSAVMIGDSLDNVYATMQMYIGTDFSTLTETVVNDLRCIVADTTDGEIAYAYVALDEGMCMCVIATRMQEGYEMDFALLDVIASLTRTW